MSDVGDIVNLYTFPDTPLPSPSLIAPDYKTAYLNTTVPIVIDNGNIAPCLVINLILPFHFLRSTRQLSQRSFVLFRVVSMSSWMG
jgi:hypothetical protein